MTASNAARVSFKVGSSADAAVHELVLGREHEGRELYARTGGVDQIYLLTKSLGSRFLPDVAAFQKRQPSKAGGGPGGPGGMGGMGDFGGMGGLPPGFGPGSKQIPPEILKQAQDQLRQQQMLKQLAEQAQKQPH